jgi:hypothetical protein
LTLITDKLIVFIFFILFVLQNSRMMAMLLSKSGLVEKKEEENRGLSRRVEDMQQQLIKANAKWTKVIFS